MTNYKAPRLVDGKYKNVIVDESGKMVNRNPTKEELKGLESEPYQQKRSTYTNEELLNYLIKFYKENGRPPAQNDFKNNHKYPSYKTYKRAFGSWSNALKLVLFPLAFAVPAVGPAPAPFASGSGLRLFKLYAEEA